MKSDWKRHKAPIFGVIWLILVVQGNVWKAPGIKSLLIWKVSFHVNFRMVSVVFPINITATSEAPTKVSHGEGGIVDVMTSQPVISLTPLTG